MTSDNLETRYHIILPGIDGASALALESEGGFHLPGWSTINSSYWQETQAVNQGALELLGVTVATLRACKLDWSGEQRDCYYLVESLSTDWEPPEEAAWIDAEAAERIEWHNSVDRTVLLGWFVDRNSDRRVAWYRPGWFETPAVGSNKRFETPVLPKTGRVDQLRSWERSSIMRVATNAGDLYFKAVARGWKHEPALTAYLSAHFPDLMPTVVAAEPESGRMLVREFPGEPLPDSKILEQWKAAYAALGRVQRELVALVPELEALDVPVRDLEAIQDELTALLGDERKMRAGMEGGLTEAEIAALRAAEPRLIEACLRLQTGPVPLSLDHGDFWPGNIHTSDEKITLFDWSDASITHPFFSLVMAEDEIAGGLSDEPAGARQVIDAYLAEWTMYAPLEELREVFDDAMLIAPLHLAMMYRSVYLPAMEFIDELDRMAPHFLRWLAGRV